jgi:hypothetical protein
MLAWLETLLFMWAFGGLLDALFPPWTLKEMVRAAERDPRFADVVRAARGEPRTSAGPLDGPARQPPQDPNTYRL